jgi:hypothetical protein
MSFPDISVEVLVDWFVSFVSSNPSISSLKIVSHLYNQPATYFKHWTLTSKNSDFSESFVTCYFMMLSRDVVMSYAFCARLQNRGPRRGFTRLN